MIANQWYGILESKDVKKGKPIGVTRMGEKLVLWRDGKTNQVYCIYDKCCHRGASLSLGKIVNHQLACPFHGFEYNGLGKVTSIPANGKNSPVPDRFKVHSYTVKEQDDFIWLWYEENPHARLEQELEHLPKIPFFKYLQKGFSYGGFAETWNVHYTRAIENQLDVVHLPFVHGDSIGRGHKTLVNGPVVKWQENRMTFYVYNTVDDGQTIPLKPHEIPDYKDLFSLQLQMPNLWQNVISKDLRIVAVFAPIDDTHTRIYIRFYQKFMKVPGLKQIVNGLSNYTNRHILHQDRRVVLTQLPLKTELKMGENLIAGDLPILEYRKKRAQLKGELSQNISTEESF